ncbi:MAG TPA: hypothetical protein VHE11_08880 [Steroidobacteraceae bacterium]|nr:hypothetical protein [Steroidobacteraceae bacterium]
MSRHPKWKALVGWQSYYRRFLEESPGLALVDHRGPHVGNEARQTELIDAIAGGRSAFLISAPAGCGKSRFALELARRLGRAQRPWEVRFVRHDEPALAEELQHLQELPQASRLILIVDDAHDCPALVQRLASICSAQRPPRIHLVCLTRPAGRAALIEALASHFPVGGPLEIDLGRPDPKVLRELIDALIPQLSPHHRDVIRRFVADSFFATVLLCSSVARQKKLPQTLSTKNLRDYALRQPIAQAIGDPCPPEKALRALAVYAACAPVHAGDAAVRSSAARHAGLPISDIEALERRVLDAGLFEMDGRGLIRPVPDLVGDLILEETCLDEQGTPTPFGRSLIGALLEQRHYERVICNCGDVARLFSRPERVDFLGEMVLERANGLSSESRAEAAGLLDGCTRLAVRQPGVVVRLIEALTERGVLRTVRPALHGDDPEIRAQRLLTSAGECDPAIVPRALEYSRQLMAGAREDEVGHRALLEVSTESCRFAVARPLAHAAAVLDVLGRWSEESDGETAGLAASLVPGFLRLEMRIRRWDQEESTPVSIGLDPADEICKLRDQALDVLIRCAGHASPAVGYAAASSLRHWASGYDKLTGELRDRWQPQLNRELDRLAAAFGKLGATTAHLPVRAAVEQQGWQWWTDGAEPFIRRGGGRILELLPAADIYSLWKALHAATLPIFPLPLDESIEPQRRRDHLLPLTAPSAPRAAELAGELFDRLDVLCHGSSAWSALLASAVSALPRQPLQPGARPYLKEFVRRHPDEAWSLVTEDAALGALGAILPALLAELRGQDSPRWREAIQRASPGTRLFELELRALCTRGDLDAVERAVVSKGLELEEAEIVHLSAEALLSSAHPALGPGLAAVMASLPRRATDVRLWELTLEAFVRWGDHLLTSAAGVEADSATRAASGELLRLLRTSASPLSWDQGPHTRQLASALAILAVAVPHTLKTWIRQDGMPSADCGENGLVLSPARFCEFVRLLRKSPAAPFWQQQFVEWIMEEPDLASIGARGLAELCGLSDPCMGPLLMRIAQQPSDSSLDALSELVGSCGRSARFVEDALTLFRQLADAPQACGLMEKEFVSTVVRADRARAGAVEGRKAALEAMDRAARDTDLPQTLRQALARARQTIQGTIEEDLLRGEAR